MPEGEVSSSGILFVPFDKLKKYNILSLQITWDLEKKEHSKRAISYS